MIFTSISVAGCGPSQVTDGLGRLATDQRADTLSFQTTTDMKAVSASLVLYNDGNKVLHISGLSIVDDDSGVFRLLDPPTTPFALEPGKKNGVFLNIQIKPLENRHYQARLRITSADADNVDQDGHFFVRLRSAPPLVELAISCPGETLNFAAVEKGRSETKECIIKSQKGGDLVITEAIYKKVKGGQRGDFEWVSPAFPFTVKSGDTKGVVVKIKYTPSDYPPREDQGAFILESNIRVERDEDKPRIKVIGLTAVALIELVPKYPECKDDSACRRIDTRLRCVKDTFTNTNLCRQPEGQTPVLKFPYVLKGMSLKRTFWLRSTGDRPLQVDDVSLDGSSSQDLKLISPGVSFPLTLEPGKEQAFVVEYTPSDAVSDAGQIRIASNAGSTPNATLSLEVAAMGCVLGVQPLKIALSASMLEQQVSLSNRGNGPCIINKVYFKSGNREPFSFQSVPQPDQTLVPNGVLSLLVRLSPKNNKIAKDFLVVESTDPFEPTVEVPLEGQPVAGDGCELTLSNQVLLFGFVPDGEVLKIPLLLQNNGKTPCDVTAVGVRGTLPANNTAFALVATPKAPFRIPALGNVHLEVSFAPPVGSESYEGELQMSSSNASQSTFKVRLAGTTGKRCLEVLPPKLDFGSIKVGCATPQKAFDVFHLGERNCRAGISITKVSLAQQNSAFRIHSSTTWPRTLVAGQSVRVELSYKANSLHVDAGILAFHNDEPGQSPILVPVYGEGSDSLEQTDVFRQLTLPLVDIAFVIDDSSSMSDNQATLAKNIQSFANWAVRRNVDYHIMVTTTDTTKTGTDASGCARGAVKVITPQTSDPAGTFVKNASVGAAGSNSEQGLEAAYRMLRPSALAGCNKGFYRKDAALSLIFVSDGMDHSPQTVQFYVSFFRSLKRNVGLDLLQASAVVGPIPSGCNDPVKGKADAAPRYLEVARQLKGAQAAICSDWAPIFINIGTATFEKQSLFFLSQAADPATITVKVDGQPVKQSQQDGWFFDKLLNSVGFTKSAIPAPGATIQIQYKVVCLP